MTAEVSLFKDLYARVDRKIRKMTDRASFQAMDSGRVIIRRLGNDDNDLVSYGRIRGLKINPGEDVVLLDVGGRKTVLGAIETSPPADVEFDGVIDLDTGDPTNTDSFIYFRSGADTGTVTNASTGTYVDLTGEDMPGPPILGLWDGSLIFMANFSNGTSGSGATMRIELPGLSGGVGGSSGSANDRFTLFKQFNFQDLAGPLTVRGEFVARTSGTATCHAWGWMLAARRTT